ncbi:MAG: SUMF1/EgtB/PvdO family nonheme iron enzyme [Planctomycetes bacterium]|nr:SUMF1/EgtB/PvdO family nonheme iron enzyme [Planctomycetota bacterium]
MPPPQNQRADKGSSDEVRFNSRLLEILDLPPTEREEGARRFGERHPEQVEALRRLLEHAKVIEDAELKGIQTPPLERLKKLRDRSGASRRYDIRREINRGGMGIIERVWDDDLGRSVAMKVMLGSSTAPSAVDPGAPTKLERFIAEAQITSQLDHPGVIPVYDVGIDEDGRLYFTMPFVKGRTAGEIFRYAREKKNDWDSSRALEVILKVCDTLAFAHERDVVHRDIKPSNIMVGRFGEVYVMDWGLAKVQGQAEEKAGRPRVGSSAAHTVIHTDRSKKRQGSSSTTQAGTILGTPSFMSPEQGFGRIEEVGPATDIYSVGALLYTLLTGYEPYQEPGANVRPESVLDSLLAGPPTPVARLEPNAPPELVAICEKAMARKVAQRYASMGELSRDLRDFLAGRVVRAHVTGPLAELRKWVARNRAFAAAAALALVALIVGLGASLVFYARERDAAQRTTRYLQEILALSRMEELRELEERARKLYPISPELAPAMEAWLVEAERLVSALPEIERDGRALEQEPAGAATLTPIQLRWRRSQIARLITALIGFRDDAGSAPDTLQVALTTIPAVRRRLEQARRVEATVASEAAAWERCVEEIAQSERYGNLRIAPQDGLVPLGADPVSHLQEFWHVGSGARPLPQPAYPAVSSSRWIVTGETGIVLVLIPGGRFNMGASHDSKAPIHHDPQALEAEAPVIEGVQLAPFLLSKYELTQGQWHRITGNNPSYIYAGRKDVKQEIDLSYPVERISWVECQEVLRCVGLSLPTEARWEYSCRAGTDDPWWSGDASAEFLQQFNLCDASYQARGLIPNNKVEAWDDGHAVQAPVGETPANPFGLHEMHGNLFEWCLDAWVYYSEDKPSGEDGHFTKERNDNRAYRGGAYCYPASWARSSWRSSYRREDKFSEIGARPAASLRP